MKSTTTSLVELEVSGLESGQGHCGGECSTSMCSCDGDKLSRRHCMVVSAVSMRRSSLKSACNTDSSSWDPSCDNIASFCDVALWDIIDRRLLIGASVSESLYSESMASASMADCKSCVVAGDNGPEGGSTFMWGGMTNCRCGGPLIVEPVPADGAGGGRKHVT